MLHTFVALVQDKPGDLTRVASLLRGLRTPSFRPSVNQSKNHKNLAIAKT